MSLDLIYDEQVPVGVCPDGVRQLCSDRDVSCVTSTASGMIIESLFETKNTVSSFGTLIHRPLHKWNHWLTIDCL